MFFNSGADDTDTSRGEFLHWEMLLIHTFIE